MVHGGVDGYSRIPVYLHCSNNNRACTVLKLFMEAVTAYGLVCLLVYTLIRGAKMSM